MRPLTLAVAGLLALPAKGLAAGAETPDETGTRVRMRTRAHTLVRRPPAGGALGESLPTVLIASGSVEGIGVEALSLEASFFGLVDPAASGPGQGDGDLRLGFLRYRPQVLDLRAGRQLMVAGVGRLRVVDGGSVQIFLPLGLTVEGFGGRPAQPLFEDGGEGWLGGARLVSTSLPFLRLMAGFTHEKLGEDARRQEVAGGIGLRLPAQIRVNGEVGADVNEGAISDVDLTLAAPIYRGLGLHASFRRSVPGLAIAPTSVLAVFAREATDDTDLSLSWRGLLWRHATVLEGGGGLIRREGEGLSPIARARALVELSQTPELGAGVGGWVKPPADWVVLELIRQEAPLGGYLFGRAGIESWLTPSWSVGGSAHLTRAEQPQGDSTLAGGGGVQGQWRPSPRHDLSVLASVQTSARSDVSLIDGLEGMLRLGWGLGPRGGSDAGAGQGGQPGPREAAPADWIRMNHAAHTDDLECAECHPGAKLPEVAICQDCHEVSHEKIAELWATRAAEALELADAEEPCGRCHADPRAARSTSMIRERRHLRFEHQTHVELEPLAGCETCHPKARTSESSGDRLTPAMERCEPCHREAFDRLDCGFCHESLATYALRPVASFSHEGPFLRTHGVAAAGRPGQCQSCHDQAFCVDCHGFNEPLRLSTRQPDRLDRSFVHVSDYVARHAYDASRDGAACLRCHGASSCQDCHQRAGLGSGGASPHPPGWSGRLGHALGARTRVVECAGCHDAGADTTCIRCHAVGGQAGNPHPSGWASTRRRVQMLSKSPCVLCHLGR